MEYEISTIVPLTPIVIRYKEDGDEREDLFFFSPAEKSLIPGFGEGEGPQDPQSFGQAFQTRMVEDMKKAAAMQESRIAVPPGTPSPGDSDGPSLYIPK